MSMRTLLLLRHAKAARDSDTGRDFDRPLAPRGKSEAPAMGRDIARLGLIPDHAIVSPARRTRETWDLASTVWTHSPSARLVDAIYEASVETLLQLVRSTPPTVQCLMLVGHNPGIEDLAADLAGPGSDAKAEVAMSAKFAPGALAVLQFGCDWAEVDPDGGILVDFFAPTRLG